MQASRPTVWVITGGPGKTTLCRALARLPQLQPLLLVDNDPAHTLDSLFKLVDADNRPSMAQLQQNPVLTLEQAEENLAESLATWSNRSVDLLRTGHSTLALTPLWRSALTRLFARYQTVVMDEWQPLWRPWLPDVTVFHLSHSWPVPEDTRFEQAHARGWVAVAQPPINTDLNGTAHLTPTPDPGTAWPPLGRLPWVDPPARKHPDYLAAVTAMLARMP
jgi:hypothetical protein